MLGFAGAMVGDLEQLDIKNKINPKIKNVRIFFSISILYDSAFFSENAMD